MASTIADLETKLRVTEQRLAQKSRVLAWQQRHGEEMEGRLNEMEDAHRVLQQQHSQLQALHARRGSMQQPIGGHHRVGGGLPPQTPRGTPQVMFQDAPDASFTSAASGAAFMAAAVDESSVAGQPAGAVLTPRGRSNSSHQPSFFGSNPDASMSNTITGRPPFAGSVSAPRSQSEPDAPRTAQHFTFMSMPAAVNDQNRLAHDTSAVPAIIADVAEGLYGSFTDAVAAMRLELLSSIPPFAASIVAFEGLRGGRHSAAGEFNFSDGAGGDAPPRGRAPPAARHRTGPVPTFGAFAASSRPKNRTLYIPGLRAGGDEDEELARIMGGPGGISGGGNGAAGSADANDPFTWHGTSVQQHFLNYASATMADSLRAVGTTMLQGLNDLHRAFYVLRPVVRSADVVRLRILEGALAVAENQRDQALTGANWIQRQAGTAVESLRALRTSVTTTLSENAGLGAVVERVVQGAALIESGAAPFHGREVVPDALLQLLQGDDDESSLTTGRYGFEPDANEVETQRLAEEFRAKCKLLETRAFCLYRSLIERENEADSLSRQLTELGVEAHETFVSTDTAVVTHMLERDASDDALLTLRQHMIEERACGAQGLRALLAAVQQRDVALLATRRDLAQSNLRAHVGVLLAQYCFHAFEEMARMWAVLLEEHVIRFSAQSFHTLSDSAVRLMLVHMEYGVTLRALHADTLNHHTELLSYIGEAEQRRVRADEFLARTGRELLVVDSERRVERAALHAQEEWLRDFVATSAAATKEMVGDCVHAALGDLVVTCGETAVLQSDLTRAQAILRDAAKIEVRLRTADERNELLQRKLESTMAELLDARYEVAEARRVSVRLDDMREGLDAHNTEMSRILDAERTTVRDLTAKLQVAAAEQQRAAVEARAAKEELARAKRSLVAESEAHKHTIQTQLVGSRAIGGSAQFRGGDSTNGYR
jgi:hypothetical protein